jgi:hypothetical protein
LPAVSSNNITIEPIPSNEPNHPPQTAVVKSPSSNDKSVLQLMNELAKFNKVYKKKKEYQPKSNKFF